MKLKRFTLSSNNALCYLTVRQCNSSSHPLHTGITDILWEVVGVGLPHICVLFLQEMNLIYLQIFLLIITFPNPVICLTVINLCYKFFNKLYSPLDDFNRLCHKVFYGTGRFLNSNMNHLSTKNLFTPPTCVTCVFLLWLFFKTWSFFSVCYTKWRDFA